MCPGAVSKGSFANPTDSCTRPNSTIIIKSFETFHINFTA
jgi:hypothetical protein